MLGIGAHSSYSVPWINFQHVNNSNAKNTTRTSVIARFYNCLYTKKVKMMPSGSNIVRWWQNMELRWDIRGKPTGMVLNLVCPQMTHTAQMQSKWTVKSSGKWQTYFYLEIDHHNGVNACVCASECQHGSRTMSVFSCSQMPCSDAVTVWCKLNVVWSSLCELPMVDWVRHVDLLQCKQWQCCQEVSWVHDHMNSWHWSDCWLHSDCSLLSYVGWYTTTYHNHFPALFPGPPGWASARRELMVQGKINRGRHTDHLAGRHSIRTNQCPPPPFHFCYRPDALPAAQPTVSKHWRQLAHSD